MKLDVLSVIYILYTECTQIIEKCSHWIRRPYRWYAYFKFKPKQCIFIGYIMMLNALVDFCINVCVLVYTTGHMFSFRDSLLLFYFFMFILPMPSLLSLFFFFSCTLQQPKHKCTLYKYKYTWNAIWLFSLSFSFSFPLACAMLHYLECTFIGLICPF